jgi:uncharacterized protein (TIGR02722 family)
MNNWNYIRIITLIIVLATIGCTTQRQVQRINPDEQTDLSGRWNDSDSRLVSEEITKQLMEEKWLPRFEMGNEGRRPVLIVGLISNKTHEHISTETFIKDIERAIINNGSARLVQAGDKRESLRDERADQQEFASINTAKKWGLELGADFMVQGTINSIVDEYNKKKTVSYQINLELTQLESNEIVWIGEKKIKKFIIN